MEFNPIFIQFTEIAVYLVDWLVVCRNAYANGIPAITEANLINAIKSILLKFNCWRQQFN